MRYILCALVVLICLTITISINIYPRLLQPSMLNIIMAIVQAGFITLAIILPSGMELSGARGARRAVGWSVWALAILVSFTFGMAGSAHFQFDATKEARLEIQDRGTSEQQLAQGRAARRELGVVPPTTEAGVAIAKAAHEAAVEGKKTECGTGVGPHCKRWDETIQVKLTEWGAVSAAYEKAKTARELDAEIKQLEAALKGKAVPQSADPMASGWAYILSSVGIRVGEEAIAAWIAIGFALALEVAGSLAPWAVMPQRKAKSGDKSDPHFISSEPEKPTVSSPRSPRKARGSRPRKSGDQSEELPTSISSVGTWYRTQVRVTPGVDIGASDTFKIYAAWCDENAAKRASPQKFSAIMKDELKVPNVKRDGKIFYTITILGTPKLVKAAQS